MSILNILKAKFTDVYLPYHFLKILNYKIDHSNVNIHVRSKVIRTPIGYQLINNNVIVMQDIFHE